MGGRTIPYEDSAEFYGESFDPYFDEFVRDPWPIETFEPIADVSYMAGPHVTVAQVSYNGESATGDAKRNKGERQNKNVGRDLAVGRAFIQLGVQLIDRAYDALGEGPA